MSLKKEENSASGQDKEEDVTSEAADNSLDSVKEEYDQLCRELNMDESTMEASWASYIAIRHNYTLEVSHSTISLIKAFETLQA